MVVNLFLWVLKIGCNVSIHLDSRKGTCRLVGWTMVPRIQVIVTMLWRGRESGGEFKAAVVDSRVDWLDSLEERDYTGSDGSVHVCWRTLHQQQLLVRSCSGVVVISEYCKGNSSAVEYLLGLKLIGLHIEDVSFATDQTERHLEVGSTGYENYDSSAKRRLFVSLGLFLRIYYKGGMLGEQTANLSRASVLTEGQPAG
ncbi:hypothetical protein Adt_17868 [Abeliophyllum distichum]|uniref:Uncharacterized protein n=1 Tax=Abeliophyllum distichum TaxID=126358 RepID=A0ABD1TIA6_9LAMI